MGTRSGRPRAPLSQKASTAAVTQNPTVVQRRRMSRVNQMLEINLSDADYKYLTAASGMTRPEIHEIYKKFHEDAVDGELDLVGFVAFYHSLTNEPPEWLDDAKHTQFVFDTFDKDHSGKVSFREFINAYVLTSAGNLEKKLEYCFELYDLDNSGYLDLDEIYRIVVQIFDILEETMKNSDQEKLQFAEDCFKKLDVMPRDGKVTKRNDFS